MKSILVKTVGQEPAREIQLNLEPGTLVADAIDQAKLVGFRLQRPSGGNFEPAENLYDLVAEGQKVYAAKVDDLSAGS